MTSARRRTESYFISTSFEKLYTVSFSRSIEKKLNRLFGMAAMHAGFTNARKFTAVLDFYRAMLLRPLQDTSNLNLSCPASRK